MVRTAYITRNWICKYHDKPCDIAPILPCFQLLRLSRFFCAAWQFRESVKWLNVRITENTFIYYIPETLTNMPTISITVLLNNEVTTSYNIWIKWSTILKVEPSTYNIYMYTLLNLKCYIATYSWCLFWHSYRTTNLGIFTSIMWHKLYCKWQSWHYWNMSEPQQYADNKQGYRTFQQFLDCE